MGETFEQAVIREVREEVNLEVEVAGLLFSHRYANGTENCYLVQIIGDNPMPAIGYDPELPQEKQVLKEVKWHPIESMQNDHQVSRVIKAMSLIKEEPA